MLKRYLLAPGPTPVPPEVLLAMARPMIHHRAPEFDPIFAEAREGLKWLFQTRNDVLMLAASGTGGMEGSVSNFLSPGDKALCINGGKFGERWGKICKTFGVQVTELKVEWGHAVNPQLVADALKKDPAIKAVYVQASETSTGVSHDVKALGEIVKAHDQTILVVDAITALGVFDIKTDAWGLDVVITGSQKALMLPPGLAFVSVSDKAWGHADKAKNAAFYFNFKKERENQVEESDGLHADCVSDHRIAGSDQDAEGRGARKDFHAPGAIGPGDARRHEGRGPCLVSQGVAQRCLDRRVGTGRRRWTGHLQELTSAVRHYGGRRTGSLERQDFPAVPHGLRGSVRCHYGHGGD